MPLKSRLRSGRGNRLGFKKVQENRHDLDGKPIIATLFSRRHVFLEAFVWDLDPLVMLGRVYTHGSQCRQFGHFPKDFLMRTRRGVYYDSQDSVKLSINGMSRNIRDHDGKMMLSSWPKLYLCCKTARETT